MADLFGSRLRQAVDHMNAGRYNDAEPILLELRSAKPLDPYVNYNLGNVYVEQKRFVEGARAFRQALAVSPDMIPALLNLSSTLIELGDRREALRHIQMALRRRPDDYKLLCNLSVILLGLGEGPDATAAIERAAEVAPKEFGVLRQWVCCLVEISQWDKVIPICERAIAAAGDRETALLHAIQIAALSRFSRWDEIATFTERLRPWMHLSETGLVPMSLAFIGDLPEEMHALASAHMASNKAAPRPKAKPADGKLTVAYMSPDFRDHPVAHMVLDVLRSHDRSRFRFLTVGVVPLVHEGLASEIAKHVDGHIDLSMLSDDQGANRLRAEGIDVLVDLAGSTMWNRTGILARRPCAVQLLWLGCPTTTGSPWYDAYLLDDTVLPPGNERFCTEPVHRLPCCYHPISTGYHGPIKDLTRKQLELPDDRFLLGLRLQPTKIIPPLTDDVIEILKRCPDILLWCKCEKDSRERFVEYFSRHGVSGDRIITQASFFRERVQYLAAFRIADLLIDSFPYGGHSTTGEALSMGCPVVTRAGRSIHTRVAASMLHDLGLDELIANSRPEYVDKVCHLVNDPQALANLRSRTQTAIAQYRETGPRRLASALEDAFLHQHNLALQIAS